MSIWKRDQPRGEDLAGNTVEVVEVAIGHVRPAREAGGGKEYPIGMTSHDGRPPVLKAMADAIYQSEAYRDLDRAAIGRSLRAEGWEPHVFADPPGFVYPPHQHPEAKLLAFLEGGMTVRVAGQTYRCAVGDKLVIPGGVEHAAEVGPEGCTFFWSER